MRKVIITINVRHRLEELEYFLVDELKLSETAAKRRSFKLRLSVNALVNDSADYALCRFRRWRELGYRCLASDGWVFAYEIVPEGIIVQDMAHSKTLYDIA
jgi:hypothetical protein